jgi:hypothetical protein
MYFQLLLLSTLPAPTNGVLNRLRAFGSRIVKVVFGSSNPCYNRPKTQPSAKLCEDVVLPSGFCTKCGVGLAIHSDGIYKNCLYTSDVELLNGTVNMECLDIMEDYVSMNPCDEQRRSGLRQYRSMLGLPNILRRLRTKSRQTLDSFVYSMCEVACDCVPQYNATIENRTIDVHRGNCQGHALADVCQLFPNIKVVRGQNGNTTIAAQTLDLSTISPACPNLQDWRDKHPGQWFDLTPTPVDVVSHKFLDGLMEATEITTSASDKLWRSCLTLESTQKRIILQQ